MAARASMAQIITRLRRLIADTDPDCQTFSDDEIQELADTRRWDVRLYELKMAETIAPSGAITYLDYYSTRGGDWETDAVLQDSKWADVTSAATTADWLTGHWAFETQPSYPLYIIGKHYDLYGTAADLLEEWAAKEKLSFNFSTDGQSFQRNQKIANLMSMAEAYRSKQKPRSAANRRRDVAMDYYS